MFINLFKLAIEYKKSTIGIAVLVIIGVWFVLQLDSRYAKAGSVNEIQTSIQSMETNQNQAIKKLDEHLAFEVMEAIDRYEKEIETLNIKIEAGISTPKERARKITLEKRLDLLRK